MINFATLQDLTIPEGIVTKIEVGGKAMWEQSLYNYVSLGDSIAVGHRIDENWETNYGWDKQYGVDGRTETVIVPNSYTDLIHKDLSARLGGKVAVTSFARSGSMVRREPVDSRSLIDILDHTPVRTALSKANLVTISIGANTILEPALGGVQNYLINGTGLPEIERKIENELRVLNNVNHDYSYKALIDKLLSINPNAQYVFTTVYNPMKYLYIERGTWENEFKDGLFGEWLSTIPEMTILYSWEVDKELKKLILDTPAFVNLRERINGSDSLISISEWVERYLETGGTSPDGTPYLGLNQVLRNAVKGYPNISVAETHELFDTVPDRQGAGELHYNDLVNVQITKGYDANDANWEALWGNAEGSTVDEKIRNYWIALIGRHINGLTLDINGLADEVMPTIVNDVLSPVFDPHPRTDGHKVLKASFENCYITT